MEQLKIWSIDNVRNATVTALNTAAQTESEGLLEDILTRNPDMLAVGLTLIGRQTTTTGGPLDLLGVEPDGRLSVFELKRGTLRREAVAQVIDLAAMDTESLYQHIAEQSGNLGIPIRVGSWSVSVRLPLPWRCRKSSTNSWLKVSTSKRTPKETFMQIG